MFNSTYRPLAAGNWSFPAELAPLDRTEQEYDSADREWPDARQSWR